MCQNLEMCACAPVVTMSKDAMPLKLIHHLYMQLSKGKVANRDCLRQRFIDNPVLTFLALSSHETERTMVYHHNVSFKYFIEN